MLFSGCYWWLVFCSWYFSCRLNIVIGCSGFKDILERLLIFVSVVRKWVGVLVYGLFKKIVDVIVCGEVCYYLCFIKY